MGRLRPLRGLLRLVIKPLRKLVIRHRDIRSVARAIAKRGGALLLEHFAALHVGLEKDAIVRHQAEHGAVAEQAVEIEGAADLDGPEAREQLGEERAVFRGLSFGSSLNRPAHVDCSHHKCSLARIHPARSNQPALPARGKSFRH